MKNLKFVLLVVILVAIGIGGWFWWQHQIVYPSTDDAYVQANVITVAPLVGGNVLSVAVVENAYVNAGDLLFEIDASVYGARLAAAEAQLDIAMQGTGANSANVTSAEAGVSSATAALKNAEQTLARQQSLFDKGDVARAALDAAQAARDEAVAGRDQERAAMEAARASLGAGGANSAAVRAARAGVESAQLDVDHASIKAPASGWVANLSLRPGSTVAAEQSLFSIVEDGHWWIDGNFKETDLERLRPDQPASITLDMYGALSISGKVESLGAGSGAVFSLLPPENASGNWVKVTQRFPVRIAIDAPPADKATPLRVGASATVTIDTSGLNVE